MIANLSRICLGRWSILILIFILFKNIVSRFWIKKYLYYDHQSILTVNSRTCFEGDRKKQKQVEALYDSWLGDLAICAMVTGCCKLSAKWRRKNLQKLSSHTDGSTKGKILLYCYMKQKKMCIYVKFRNL